MNTELIKKNLADSFDVLKDSWEQYCDAITLCIAEMMKYDGEMAIEMWLYILEKNKALLASDIGTKKLIPEIIDKMYHIRYDYLSRREEIFLNEIIPCMLHREEILTFIFGKAHCAGAEKDDIFGTTLLCFAYILLIGNNEVVMRIMESLYSNKRMIGLSTGEFLYQATELLKDMFSDKDIPYDSLGLDKRDTLMRSLDYINDPLLKAECTVSIITLIQLCTDKNTY
ncbi:MAG: hypothetical protein IJJ56_04970 [Prevotella sp.]|nr:hypothetical protein [Prevotella sp.]